MRRERTTPWMQISRPGTLCWISFRGKAHLLYHIYSGQLFFSAAILVLAAVVSDLFGWLNTRPLARRLAAFLTVFAVPLAALSGTPVRMVMAIPTIVATLGYALFGFGARWWLRYSLGGLAIALVAIAVATEIPYHLKRS
ncbi:MAG TPA: hypothetical protein VII12_10890, partial [Thermoanaerobaculia bacterium]